MKCYIIFHLCLGTFDVLCQMFVPVINIEDMESLILINIMNEVRGCYGPLCGREAYRAVLIGSWITALWNHPSWDGFLSPGRPRLPALGQGYLLPEVSSPGGDLNRPYLSFYSSHRTL